MFNIENYFILTFEVLKVQLLQLTALAKCCKSTIKSIVNKLRGAFLQMIFYVNKVLSNFNDNYQAFENLEKTRVVRY